MFCKSVGCGDFKLVGVCGWAEHLGGTLASLAACGTKKKKKMNIVSRKSSFSPAVSLSHTHKHIHAHTLFLSLSLSLSLFSLPLVYSFYCSVCLSTGCLLAVAMVHCFIYFVYLFLSLLCWV